MIIQVNPHRIVLNKTNEVNSGEYNVNECTFEFSQEYEGLTKVAVFSLCDGTTKNVTILNNQCIIPVECLQETGQVQIGVYGYATENGNLVLRYSPTPQNFVVRLGSYKEGTQPVAPTPTDWEILVEQVSDIAEDVSSIHEDITGINGEISGINTDIRDLQDTKANINDLATVAFTGEFSDLKNIPSYATTQQLNQEIQDRQDADVNLQSQIDAISVSSDVVDVVGTYQELLDYDTQHLKDNDIVKVLQDSTHSDALSYYRWDKETSTWSYVGSEGPFYTKSETDALLNKKQDVIDIDNMLSSDLVDDTNSTNKFVTQADINNWNNKEDKSNKVTEINSSSTDAQYPSAKCVYDSQEEQNEHITELEMLYNAFPTVSDENETIQLDNTAKVKFREIDLKGNTSQVVIPEEQGTNVSNTSIYVSDVNTDKENTIEMSGNTYQETTTGKNLFNKYGDFTYGNTNYKTSLNAQGQIVSTSNFYNNRSAGILINVNQNTDYTISGKILSADGTGGNNVLIQILNTSGQSIQLEKWASTITKPFDFNFTFNSGGNSQIWVSFNGSNSGTAGNTNTIFDNIQMEQGTTATTYEPFTNGASPNPSFPQNIEVVTGQNDIFIQGKNLCPTQENDWEQGSINSQNGSLTSSTTRLRTKKYYPIKNDTNYHISVQDNTNYCFLNIHFYNENKQWIGSMYGLDSVDGQTSKTINISSNDIPNIAYMRIIVRNIVNNATINTNEILIIKPQIELGTSSTTFENYVSQTYPINLGNIELCKISTYQDRIYKRNDKWYLEKNIGKITLNGSEEWEAFSNVNYEYQLVLFDGATTDTDNQYFPAICSNYINRNVASTLLNNYEFSHFSTKPTPSSTQRKRYVRFRNNEITTLQNWKNNLESNNSIIYIPLATPTTTEITNATLVNQLNALYNATIYPITNINTDTSNLLPYIDLHYNFVTPSPSPSRPSVVNVVKGNNTITISNSDNTESQNYPINLGDIELCKIGTYQDYIYESNGNWFKKGNIGKVVLNGSESWEYGSRPNTTSSTIKVLFNYMIENYYSNNFIYNSSTDNRIVFSFIVSNKAMYLRLSNSLSGVTQEDSGTTIVEKISQWLSTHNTIVYYVIETPTDTQITDATLITQLNNIKKAYSYDTQTNISQTNTDKPFIIYAEAIRSLKDVFE